MKSAQFSWTQLKDSYPFLGPEMRSTGEAASLGTTFHDALLKSWLSCSPNRLPRQNKTALVYGKGNLIYLREAGHNLEKLGLTVKTLNFAEVADFESVNQEIAQKLIGKGEVDLVITNGYLKTLDYNIRRSAVDLNIPVILNGRLAREVTQAMVSGDMTFYEMRKYGGGI